MNAVIESEVANFKNNDHAKKIENFLLSKYGPFLSVSDVSTILHKSEETIKKYLTSKTIKTNSTIKTLRAAKRRIGRSIVFDALTLSSLFSE